MAIESMRRFQSMTMPSDLAEKKSATKIQKALQGRSGIGKLGTINDANYILEKIKKPGHGEAFFKINHGLYGMLLYIFGDPLVRDSVNKKGKERVRLPFINFTDKPNEAFQGKEHCEYTKENVGILIDLGYSVDAYIPREERVYEVRRSYGTLDRINDQLSALEHAALIRAALNPLPPLPPADQYKTYSHNRDQALARYRQDPNRKHYYGEPGLFGLRESIGPRWRGY